MKFHVINTGTFKLDGGAMFGVVPKILWQKVYPADENNLCAWALRCLLIETEDRKILIDCGIGDKQSEKFCFDSIFTCEFAFSVTCNSAVCGDLLIKLKII